MKRPAVKVVIDTNVWISGLLKSKIARLIIKAFSEDKFLLYISDDILNELATTLNKPAFINRINHLDSANLISLIRKKSVFVKTSRLAICRDPKDDIFLECALAAEADVLISWDIDLLVLLSFKKTEIISPEEFLRRFIT